MEKQIPVELEVSDPIEIELDPDLCVIRDMQGGNRLVIESKVSKSELENLARDCMDILGNIYFTQKFYKQYGYYREEMYLNRRMDTIVVLLEHEGFRAAIASTEEKWEKTFTEAEEIEKNLEPCKSCGAKRDYYDYACPGIPDGYCKECDPANDQPDNRSDLGGLQMGGRESAAN